MELSHSFFTRNVFFDKKIFTTIISVKVRSALLTSIPLVMVSAVASGGCPSSFRRWRHSYIIRVGQCICCNLKYLISFTNLKLEKKIKSYQIDQIFINSIVWKSSLVVTNITNLLNTNILCEALICISISLLTPVVSSHVT